MSRAASVTVCEKGGDETGACERTGAESRDRSRTSNSAYESVTSAHADERPSAGTTIGQPEERAVSRLCGRGSALDAQSFRSPEV
jgi:hypothetical protein